MRGKPLDITGKRFGNLTAIISTGKKDSNNCRIWLFKCDCGNFEERSTQHLKRMEKGVKCKNCDLEQRIKHGATHSQIYRAWLGIKARCLNVNSPAYKYYGGAGITMQSSWTTDFVAFRDCIGNPPDDGKKYSIDRIDNSLGYQEGNIRWATDHQQARNKTKTKVNTTGVTGVIFEKTRGRYTANWYDLDGKYCIKHFPVKKLGEKEAFKQACEYREAMIRELNLQGAGYSENHGK